MDIQLDELDIGILKALNKDARKSSREIAKELKLSASAVLARIKKMESAGVITGYMPILNYQKLGYEFIAVIAIKISKGKLIEVQKKVAHFSQVFAIYDITGEWDSIAIGRFKNREELNNFIKKVLSIKYVERTITHIVLNTVKEEHRLVL